MRAVLVTGGAGFIGSHTCKLLRARGYLPVSYDNLSTGNRKAALWGPLVEADIADAEAVSRTCDEFQPVAVIHFAASAYVGESVENPEKYYRNNVFAMLSLLRACREADLRSVVFSSSCAVYGSPARLPIREDDPLAPISPYGRTKLIGEQILGDYAQAYGFRFAALRYFNACGADPDGEIAEWHDPETHIIPRALLAAAGRVGELEIFGDDYPTEDGTAVRDYVHVVDLARAHVLALERLLAGGQNIAVNLGSGRGSSIRQLLAAIKQTTGRETPYVVRPRRSGDPAALFADIQAARETLGFQPELSDLTTIVRTAAPSFGLTAVASADRPHPGLGRANAV